MVQNLSDSTGGWIQGLSGIRKPAYQQLEDVNLADLNKKYIRYFENYRKLYFYDRFKPAQGLEEILTALQRHNCKPKSWLDVGGGVTSLFWSLAIDSQQLSQIDICDLSPEALYVLRRFVQSKEVPACYTEALKFLRKNQNTLQDRRSLQWRYHIFDGLLRWPEQACQPYHLITAIGCLGLSKTHKHYQAAFSHCADNLISGGVFFGVDWIRSAALIEKEQHDNSYLGIDLTRSCATQKKLDMLYLQRCSILHDPAYDKLIIWIFKKP